LYIDGLKHIPLMLLAIVVGTAGGVFGAQKVKMTQMPQMVALFNGVGGGAAALAALLELHHMLEVEETLPAGADGFSWSVYAATAFAVVVGAVSFAGSAVTVAVLQELVSSRRLVLPGLAVVFGALLLSAVVRSVVSVAESSVLVGVVLVVVGLLFGVLLVLRV